MEEIIFTEKNPRLFYDPESFPFLKTLADNTGIIRKELLQLIGEEKQKRWTSIFPEYVSSGNRDSWRTFTFLFFCIRSLENAELCPETAALINAIPQIISCDYSRLNANTRIFPHKGFTKTILRCHLPLVVPDEKKCGIKVRNETRHWKEGELLVFDDSFEHEAWNDSDAERIVLMFDIPNPAWGYTAEEIAKYKIENLEDEFLLSVFPKEKWLEMLRKKQFIFSQAAD